MKTENSYEMKPTLIFEALKTCAKAKVPVTLWGDPGVGKSDLVRQLGKQFDLPVLDIRVALLDPVDLRGLPHVNGDGKAHWAIPSFLPTEGKGILFLDEFNRGPVMVQNGCLQLVLDGKLGEYVLPPDYIVIAACNYRGPGVQPLSPAMKNRFEHLYMSVDVEDWIQWALRNNVNPLVIAAIRWRNDLLFNPSDKEDAYPTPRSIAKLSKLVDENPTSSIEQQLYAGAIGKFSATEFMAFLKLYRELPSIDELLADPEHSVVPTSPQTLFAIATALGRKMEASNLNSVFKYLNRIGEEYQVLAVHDATARNEAIGAEPAFTKWFLKHNEVFKPMK